MKIRFWGTRGSIPSPGRGTIRYGGNCSCVEIRTRSGELFIIDAGTGIRELGISLMAKQPVTAHILLSHTHWDHISGFPFFPPAFAPGNELTIYAARNIDKRLEDVMAGQMEYTYFPVTLSDLPADIIYRELLEETYEMIIKSGFSVPPYPAGIASLLQDLEKTSPKAKGAKPEDFADSRLVKELDQNGFIRSLVAGR